MNLSLIKTNKCPHCGCTLIAREEVQTDINYRGEVEIRRHAHGGRWETRAFACGWVVNYSPNFEREEQASQCTKSKEYIDKQRIHQEEIQKLIDYANNLNFLDEAKERLRNQIRFWI